MSGARFATSAAGPLDFLEVYDAAYTLFKM